MNYEAPAGVIERWQPELDRIAPVTDEGLSWLKLVWEPGEVWSPVGRWIVYEMTPAHRAPLGIYEELKGPNPRWFGEWDRVLRRFVRTRSSSISQRQWKLHEETGCFGRPLWVVQGKMGGHKRYWSEVESKLSRIHGGPQDPPAPGDLCYAEPDLRTIQKLAYLDLVRRYGDILHQIDKSEALRDSLDLRDREIAKGMARQMYNWMGDQIAESLTFTRDQVGAIWDNADPDAEVPDFDRMQEDFVDDLALSTAH